MTADLEFASQKVIWFKAPVSPPAWTAAESEMHQSPLVRTKITLAEVQASSQKTPISKGDTQESKCKPSPMGVKQHRASTPVPSCNFRELLQLQLHRCSSPFPIHSGYHCSFIQGNSIQWSTVGRQVCPPPSRTSRQEGWEERGPLAERE